MQKVQRGMNHWRNKIGKPEFNHKDFKVEHVDVTIQGLDPSFNDYCIANISDIHLGQWITPKHLDGVIDILNKENPDSITITGDFISYVLDDVAWDLENSLKRLKPKDSTIAVLGNHDHWLGAEKFAKY